MFAPGPGEMEFIVCRCVSARRLPSAGSPGSTSTRHLPVTGIAPVKVRLDRKLKRLSTKTEPVDVRRDRSHHELRLPHSDQHYISVAAGVTRRDFSRYEGENAIQHSDRRST